MIIHPESNISLTEQEYKETYNEFGFFSLLSPVTDLKSWYHFIEHIIPKSLYEATSLQSSMIIKPQSLLFESWAKSFQRDYSENSTIEQKRPDEIDKKIMDVFQAATEEVFEDGMEDRKSVV